MTENEAIQNMKKTHLIVLSGASAVDYEDSIEIAIQALEEIQQYRAIGTVEELKSMKENGAFTGVELASLACMQMKLKDYQSIGTIEEFKALKDCGTHDCIIKHLSGECSYKETGCSDCKSKEMTRTAVERMKPKKVLYRKQYYGTPWLCPECEADQIKVEFFNEDGSEPQEKHTFCWKCGTVIDWSE